MNGVKLTYLAALSAVQLSAVSVFSQELVSPTLASNHPAGNVEISITAVGDVMLGSWVTPVLAQRGAVYPFEASLPYLQSADFTIANLEAPFTREGEPFEKKFNFKVPPEYARGLKDAGIDVVTLANNHILDYGAIGLVSTMATLDTFGIKYSGAGRNWREAHQPTVVEIRGKRIAFFGYSTTFPTEFYAHGDSAGTAYPEAEAMQSALREWDERADFVVASFHWSAEKLEIPKAYQIELAHLAIDSGADLVLGHHPHVLQGIEKYRSRLIAYSLGNFAFGSYSSYAVDSIILKVYLNQDGLFYARCIPINVNNSEVEFQPQILDGPGKQAVIAKLQKLSLDLNAGQNLLSDSGLIFGDWGQFYDTLSLSATTDLTKRP